MRAPSETTSLLSSSKGWLFEGGEQLRPCLCGPGRRAEASFLQRLSWPAYTTERQNPGRASPRSGGGGTLRRFDESSVKNSERPRLWGFLPDLKYSILPD
jgi:hypothetical protein